MSLPGNTRPLTEPGCTCNYCQGAGVYKNAVMELCTEADSMGAEWTPVCQDCLTRAIRDEAAAREADGYCEWCQKQKLDIRPYRDWEEGSNGPVYDVCADCRSEDAAARAAMAEELGLDDNTPGEEDWRDDEELDSDREPFPTDPDNETDEVLSRVEKAND